MGTKFSPKFFLTCWIILIGSDSCVSYTQDQEQMRCEEYEFTCTNGQCVEEYGECDGKADCSDESDETKDLCHNFPCPSNYFKCDYGACIDKKKMCDNFKDCVDNSDEKHCNTLKGLSEKIIAIKDIPTTSTPFLTRSPLPEKFIEKNIVETNKSSMDIVMEHQQGFSEKIIAITDIPTSTPFSISPPLQENILEQNSQIVETNESSTETVMENQQAKSKECRNETEIGQCLVNEWDNNDFLNSIKNSSSCLDINIYIRVMEVKNKIHAKCKYGYVSDASNISKSYSNIAESITDSSIDPSPSNESYELTSSITPPTIQLHDLSSSNATPKITPNEISSSNTPPTLEDPSLRPGENEPRISEQLNTSTSTQASRNLNTSSLHTEATDAITTPPTPNINDLKSLCKRLFESDICNLGMKVMKKFNNSSPDEKKRRLENCKFLKKIHN